MTAIELHHISKSFDGAGALDDVSFAVAGGEFVAIFGPNGCGKSTLLSMIAGLEKPDGGRISITGASADEPRIGFVFQNYNESMLPWRTAGGNVELALEARGIAKAERKRRAEELLKSAGLGKVANEYFYRLSGGMKQLTAICRAFGFDPDVLLLDEPFSALDYSTTRAMETELLRIWEQSGCTAVCVSHDVDEAVFLADRVVVLSPRPATIRGIVEISLPRPRTRNMLISEEFFALRSEILRLFDYEERRR